MRRLTSGRFSSADGEPPVFDPAGWPRKGKAKWACARDLARSGSDRVRQKPHPIGLRIEQCCLLSGKETAKVVGGYPTREPGTNDRTSSE